ncbi:hypothetical protein SK128_014052, partial [Halocaridina rubra]
MRIKEEDSDTLRGQYYFILILHIPNDSGKEKLHEPQFGVESRIPRVESCTISTELAKGTRQPITATTATMADGMLALSWNNHASTFCHMLSHIRLKDKYADATVACEGKFYPVHRIVLSTCSKYFEEMFELTSAGKHPIVLLQDVRKYELEAILSYMYAGVVSVAQKDLARLIKVAELLQIKGLAVPDELPSEKRGGSGQNSGNAGERTSKSSYLSEHGEDRASPYRKRRRREEPLLSSRATAVSAGNRDDDDIQEIKTSDYLSKDFRESSDDDNRGFTDPGQSVVNTEGRSMESDRLQRQPSADPTMNSSKDAKEDMLCIKEEVMDEPSDTGGNPVKTEIPYEPLGDNLEESVDLPLNDQDDYSHSSGQMPSESTAEALAGPSGIHEWLSGGDLAAMENYGGEGSPQPSDPSQAQQM